MLYELLAGKPPFVAPTFVELCLEVTNRPTPAGPAGCRAWRPVWSRWSTAACRSRPARASPTWPRWPSALVPHAAGAPTGPPPGSPAPSGDRPDRGAARAAPRGRRRRPRLGGAAGRSRWRSPAGPRWPRSIAGGCRSPAAPPRPVSGLRAVLPHGQPRRLAARRPGRSRGRAPLAAARARADCPPAPAAHACRPRPRGGPPPARAAVPPARAPAREDRGAARPRDPRAAAPRPPAPSTAEATTPPARRTSACSRPGPEPPNARPPATAPPPPAAARSSPISDRLSQPARDGAARVVSSRGQRPCLATRRYR